MIRHVVAVCTAVALTACSGATESAATELWPPPGPYPAPATVSAGHPLRPLLDAFERGDCGEVVSESSRLMGEVRARVAAELHGSSSGSEAGTGSSLAAATMRRLLDDYVYSHPPMLVLGAHRFHFPHWWSSGYADCLVAEARYDDAASVFALMLQDEVDADAMWRLALVYAWSGREGEAIGVLEAWPTNLTQPAELPNVLETLRRGGSVPGSEPAQEGLPD